VARGESPSLACTAVSYEQSFEGHGSYRFNSKLGFFEAKGKWVLRLVDILCFPTQWTVDYLES
jgi:hypothetical protein